MKTEEQLMPFPKFKFIMNKLIEIRDKKERISDFFEKELMTDSYCYLSIGAEVEDALTCLVADEFECWYSFDKNIKDFTWWDPEQKYRAYENDIESWLYTISDGPKSITINGEEIPINSIEELYDFLVKQATGKFNTKLTESEV